MNMKSSLFLVFLAIVAVGAFADVIVPCGETAANKSTDAATIQAAIDGAGAGGTITLGEGTFYISAELAVTNGVSLVGQGSDKTILRPTSGLAWAGIRCASLDNGATLSHVTVAGFSYYSSWKGGAGLQVVDGTVSWCCISNVTATGYNVYGVAIELKKGTVDHSIVVGNRGNNSGAGGGIGGYSVSGPCLIDACLVCGNAMPNSEGGGICFTQGSPEVTIRNTTIVGNSSKNSGAGLKISVSKLMLQNCIVSGNMKGDTEDNVSGTPKTSTTNLIGGDQKFKDAANGDYHLTAASPAKFAGTTYADIGNDLDDVAFAAVPSVGCYEYAASGTAVETPEIDPADCSFVSPIQVTVSCLTDGATIRYTTDGSDPDEYSQVYEGPVEIADATTTLKVRAFKNGLSPSEVVSALYTFEAPVSPAFGTVSVTPRLRKATLSGTIATVGNDGATACDVYLAYGTDAENLPALTKIASGTADSFDYTITGLAPETTYYYVLSVSNNAVTVRGSAMSGTFETLSLADAIVPYATAVENRVAIQEAIDAVAASAEPGTVTLAAGSFPIDAQLMVTGGVTLVGQGWTNTVIRQTVSGQRCATVGNGAKLEKVTLTGGKTTSNWTHGAGVLVENGTVSWCCISNNVATAYNIYGAGVSISKGTIDHSIVAFNSAYHSGSGGGIGGYNAAGPVTIDACLVYGNSMPVDAAGGGVGFAVGNPAISVRNSTITDNDSLNAGAGVKAGVSRLTLVNTIVTGNRMGETEDNVSGTLAEDSTNNFIGGDPKFKDAASRDYSLTANSPAKGVGVAYEGIGTDLAGADFANPPSIGCYEYVSSLTAVESPIFEPETGSAFSTPMGVKLVCGTDGATIYYTTDGTDPSETSSVYEEPIVISETTTIKAFAAKAGMDPSEIVSATYTHEDSEPPEMGELTLTPKWNKVIVSGTLASVGNDWATACDVYFACGADEESLTNAVQVVSGATEAFEFRVRGLTPETTYHYILTVSNNAATVRGAATGGTFATTVDPGALQPVVGDPAATRQLIQESIEDAAALSATGSVVLAEGVFEIDAQLLVDGGVTLSGQGWEKTVIRQTAAASSNGRVASVSGNAKIEKVTLTGGHVKGNWGVAGGVLVKGGTVSCCCISNNVIDTGNNLYGGGIYVSDATGRIDHSLVADNLVQATTGDASFGGGICVKDAREVEIDTCLVRDNRSVDVFNVGHGGGLYVENVQHPVTVRNTTFVTNVAGVVGATPGIRSGVQLAASGGAVYWSTGLNKVTMVNCIFSDNVTSTTNLTVKLAYTAGVDYCLFDVAEDKLGEHSLVGAPHFKNATAGNYRLAAESPARHAGVREAGVDRDLDGVPFARKPAMGCYELTGGFMLLVR